jgi:hypothetical protein
MRMFVLLSLGDKSPVVKHALLRIAAVIITTTVSAETFDYSSRDGFAITIPPGWQAIPESRIQEMVTALRKATPTATVPDFRYGYQAQSDRWFSYPYVLIWVNPSGRVLEHELEKVAKVDLSKSADELRSSMSDLISSFEVGKPAYDPGKHILWMTSEAIYSGVGKVGILSGAVQTEEGPIWVYGYALRDTFESYKPTFIGITESVRPTEALRYKRRFSDSAPVAAVTDSLRGIDWSQVLAAGLVGGIIALIIGMFSARKSRKNQKQ